MYKYNSPRYKSWREKVYARDKYTCRLCGQKGTLNAHHIKRKADYPALAHRVTNGISLCIKCHAVVNNHESLFEILFNKIVKNILTIDYIYQFFANLSEEFPDIVRELKAKDKWLKIPNSLLNKPEYKNESTRTRTRTTQKIKSKSRKTPRKA